MDGNEHRSIGDEAFGGALVNVGGEFADERFWLSYGDVMALSGDYLRPEPPVTLAGENAHANLDALVPRDLFSLARVPGHKGTKPDTRDEIVCALKVMTIDEAFVDPRFEPGGGTLRCQMPRKTMDSGDAKNSMRRALFTSRGGVVDPLARVPRRSLRELSASLAPPPLGRRGS